MYENKFHMIICEQSELLKTGLFNILRNKLGFSTRIEFCEEKNLSTILHISRPQILIAKPEILKKVSNKDFPLLKMIGLIYAYYDPKSLNFDGAIHFNDSKEQIVDVIKSLNSNTSVKSDVPLIEEDILTNREKEILTLLVNGSITKEISEKLFISVHTVNNHRKNIIKKLGISTISGLTIYAVIHKYIDPKKIIKSMK